MAQSYNVKQSDDLDELIVWMERLIEPYEFRGERWRKHIDAFQIVPLPDSQYTCIVIWSELSVEGEG